jgi:hypothetical protein
MQSKSYSTVCSSSVTQKVMDKVSVTNGGISLVYHTSYDKPGLTSKPGHPSFDKDKEVSHF